MNVWKKRVGKTVKGLSSKKKRKMLTKQSREVEMTDVMPVIPVKDADIFGAREISGSVVDLGVSKDDKKMKGIIECCSKQEDHPKYDLSNSKSTYGGPSSTSCEVCMDVFSISNLIWAPSCKHRICKDCIKTYLRKEIQEDLTQMVCPESKCKEVLKPEFCRRFIPEEVYLRWRSELALASSFGKRKIECPYDDCEEEFMDDAKGYAIRACPKCWNLICMPCGGVEWHIGKDCKTFQMENMYSWERRRGYGLGLNKYMFNY